MRMLWMGALALVAAQQPPPPAELSKPTGDTKAVLDHVRAGGSGAEARARGWRLLVQVGPEALLPVLGEMDRADRVTANWLRTAAEAIVEQALATKQPLPAGGLLAFVRDRKHAPNARRVA